MQAIINLLQYRGHMGEHFLVAAPDAVRNGIGRWIFVIWWNGRSEFSKAGRFCDHVRLIIPDHKLNEVTGCNLLR